ncbi:Alpha/Beta hydrolase protein [Apiosordaria backusii]|uniref:Alpha/Beta hydrolase protein n=1 Tax=Apiosordaria backusii TaxID=314023 RepID=A0AA40EYT6_9PEZI|nr:Alpha/Beta hydrolase protein [Apiosordaria backusii]
MSSSSHEPSSSASNPLVQQTLSLMSTAAGYMRLPAIATSGLAALLTALLYFKQKALIYPSSIPANARTDVPRPSQYHFKDYEELIIPTNDGEKLSAFYIRGPRKHNPNSDVTVLMFHGNAGNIGHRLPIARMLIAATGCNVFMLEYRGYGISTGTPDESGLNMDAQTALDYLRDRAETRNHKIVVYGQSLGVGLVLENTFLSMRKLIPSIMPPAKYLAYLCHQVWGSDGLIGAIKVPTLFLSGLQDEIVPYVSLCYVCCWENTDIFEYNMEAAPGGDHNSSVIEEGYFEAIAEFINRVVRGRREKDEKDEL